MTNLSNSLAPQIVSAGELLLRPFVPSDESAVAAALRDADILRWVAGRAVIEAREVERARRWLEPRIDGWANRSAAFAVADAAHGTLYGSVSIRDIGRLPDQAVMAYWVAPEHRGRGIAHRALDAAACWAFAPAADGGFALHRLTLDHALLNVGSCRTAAKAGFRIEGTMRDFYAELTGERHDSHLHARLATDPVPFR